MGRSDLKRTGSGFFKRKSEACLTSLPKVDEISLAQKLLWEIEHLERIAPNTVKIIINLVAVLHKYEKFITKLSLIQCWDKLVANLTILLTDKSHDLITRSKTQRKRVSSTSKEEDIKRDESLFNDIINHLQSLIIPVKTTKILNQYVQALRFALQAEHAKACSHYRKLLEYAEGLHLPTNFYAQINFALGREYHLLEDDFKNYAIRRYKQAHQAGSKEAAAALKALGETLPSETTIRHDSSAMIKSLTKPLDSRIIHLIMETQSAINRNAMLVAITPFYQIETSHQKKLTKETLLSYFIAMAIINERATTRNINEVIRCYEKALDLGYDESRQPLLALFLKHPPKDYLHWRRLIIAFEKYKEYAKAIQCHTHSKSLNPKAPLEIIRLKILQNEAFPKTLFTEILACAEKGIKSCHIPLFIAYQHHYKPLLEYLNDIFQKTDKSSSNIRQTIHCISQLIQYINNKEDKTPLESGAIVISASIIKLAGFLNYLCKQKKITENIPAKSKITATLTILLRITMMRIHTVLNNSSSERQLTAKEIFFILQLNEANKNIPIIRGSISPITLGIKSIPGLLTAYFAQKHCPDPLKSDIANLIKTIKPSSSTPKGEKRRAKKTVKKEAPRPS